MIKGIRSKIFGTARPSEPQVPVSSEPPQPPPARHRRLEDRSDSAESVISAQCTFQGDISGPAGVRIAGELLGNIRSEGLIRVELTGKVKGNIESPYVILEGDLKGDICSARHVELRSRAKMRGNIKTELLAIADGCVFEGQVNMPDAESQPVKFTEKRNP